MLIKVCGMREPANIREVEALGIDLMGFIFYGKSPRCVREKPRYLPEACARVGVFVNTSVPDILDKVRDFGLNHVQLHGDEDMAFAHALKDLLPEGVKIIRAIPVRSPGDASRASLWDGVADLLLFETPSSGYGGSGERFDWQMLDAYHGRIPFLLAGGIGPGSIDSILALSHPRFAGVDLNSGFESAPALKDVERLEHFIEELKTDKI